MKKYSKEDVRVLAAWALDCAERVLPLFAAIRPGDDRPSAAIEVGRDWVATGVFSMPVIRRAALNAHAAAKDVDQQSAASFAAHAAGQAVATAHVAQHAYGGAYYALKAIAAAYPREALPRLVDERAWQAQHLAGHLRDDIMQRLILEERKGRPYISVRKDSDF